MDSSWKAATWQQFGAAIDMLENALLACPEPLWGERGRQPQYWYSVFHTLFFLDYYLSESARGFAPPAPFTRDELDPRGLLPERVYSQAELHAYLEHGRDKCRRAIRDLSDARAGERCGFERPEVTVLELHLYNLRHVQHHTAQLNLILRQETGSAPGWVSQAACALDGE